MAEEEIEEEKCLRCFVSGLSWGHDENYLLREISSVKSPVIRSRVEGGSSGELEELYSASSGGVDSERQPRRLTQATGRG